MADPAVVASTEASTLNTPSITVNNPTNASGDELYYFVSSASAYAVGTPTGLTLIQTFTGNGDRIVQWFSKTSGGSEPSTVTFSGGWTDRVAFAYSISNVGSTGTPATSEGWGSSITAPSITVSAGSMSFDLFFARNETITYASADHNIDSNSTSFAIDTNVGLSAGATGDKTATMAGSTNWGGAQIEILGTSGGTTITSNVPVTTVSVTAPAPTTTTTTVSSVPTTAVSVSAPVPTTTTEIVSAVPVTSVSVSAPAPTTTETAAVPATPVTVTAPTPTTATTEVSSVPTATVSVAAPVPTTTTTVVSLVPETPVTVTAPVPTTSQSGVTDSLVPVTTVTVTAHDATTNVVALDSGRTGGAWLPIIYVDENGDPVDKKEIKKAVKKVRRQAKKSAPKVAQEARQQATVAIEALDLAVPTAAPLDDLLEAARRIDERTERLIEIFVQAQERNRQDEAALLLLLAA